MNIEELKRLAEAVNKAYGGLPWQVTMARHDGVTHYHIRGHCEPAIAVVKDEYWEDDYEPPVDDYGYNQPDERMDCDPVRVDIARHIAAANPAAVLELIEKLDAAHAELEAIREDNHRMMLEIDGLRKELAKMREQEPVAWKHENGNVFLPWQKDLIVTGAKFSPLYAAPVPVPAPTVPDADSVARFEQWVLAQADARPNLKRGRGTLCNKYPDGSYHTLWVDMAWEGWNARAMLQSAEVTK